MNDYHLFEFIIEAKWIIEAGAFRHMRQYIPSMNFDLFHLNELQTK